MQMIINCQKFICQDLLDMIIKKGTFFLYYLMELKLIPLPLK